MSLCAVELDIDALLRSDNQELIKNAVQGGLYIVESSYQLEDSTGQRFGMDGKNYFSRVDNIGFVIDNGIVVPDDVLKPWRTDESFNHYANTHKPVLHEVSLRLINDSTSRTISSEKTSNMIALWKGYVGIQDNTITGFSVDTTIGVKDGWMVLLYDHGEKNIRCIRKQISIDSIGEQRVTVPSDLRRVMGGIYVVPKVYSAGQIIFMLCGVVLPTKGGKQLTILNPFVGTDYSEFMKPISVGKLQPIVDESTAQKKERNRRNNKGKNK